MNNNPMQDPNQPPYSEQYGTPNYYPPQPPPYPAQPATNYPPQQPSYPAPDAGWNAPPAYSTQPAPGYPAPGYPSAGYPQAMPGYPDANQAAYGQSNYTQPTPGYANAAPYGQANPNYANPAYAQPNYYGVPPVARKSHTGRNIVIGLVVFIVIVGGVIGLVSLLHKGSTSQSSSGSNYPAYLPGHGTLALNDALQSADNWSNTGDGHCVFDNNVFHVRTLSTEDEYNCWSQSTNGALNNATNSAFEAQMKIVQGDCGGLDTRVAESSFSGHHKFYFFSVCDDGNFAIFKYNVNTLGVVTVQDFAHSSAIKQGLNVTNTLDFVANGSTLTLFINAQQVAKVQDNALTAGTFGLAANPGRNDVTDVSFSNAKVWTI